MVRTTIRGQHYGGLVNTVSFPVYVEYEGSHNCRYGYVDDTVATKLVELHIGEKGANRWVNSCRNTRARALFLYGTVNRLCETCPFHVYHIQAAVQILARLHGNDISRDDRCMWR